MATLQRGTLFAPELVSDLFNKVTGHSSIARLSAQIPVAFNGNEVFTFNFDKEVDIVAENGPKSAGGLTVTGKNIVPIKVEYGARVTDEFMYASEEKQLDILRAFNDGYAKKVARGLDIMAMHGLNPRTNTAATATIGTNSFDTDDDVTTITYTAADPEANLEAAIAAIGDYDATGFAFSKTFAAALAALKVNGVPQYPEFKLGANPGVLGGRACDVNSTVSVAASGETPDQAILGDFANAFKWGYAKQIPLEVIPYGDPDQSGEDLKAHNQVYLRAETYIGWAILAPEAFAVIR